MAAESKIQLVTNRAELDKRLPVVTMALPFFKSNNPNSKYYHRVRFIKNHKIGNYKMHTSVSFWCGSSGFLHSGKGRLYKETDGDRCAVCEGKAIGAGEDGYRVINGKDVMYSPRKTSLTVTDE